MMTVYTLTLTDGAVLARDVPGYLYSPQPTVTETVFTHESLTGALAYLLSLADSAAVSSAPAGNTITQDALTESSTITDAATAVKLIVVALDETAELTGVATGNAIVSMLLEDGIEFAMLHEVGGEQFVVWVANADTFAHSRYDNFSFNSFCRIGERYYGAADDGIYVLDSNTDAGKEIKFFATTPTSNLGSDRVKRLPKIYMGFKSDGPMYLQTLTDDGKRRIYLFNKKSPQMAGSGATLGRGVKSIYWTFDLLSGEGAKAVIDSVEFFPITLIRRINS